MLAVLLRQSLLLSVAVALLWSLRPLLLRRLGAGATYAAWILVPALLLTPVLPRPAQEPLRLALQATRGDPPAALPSLPMPSTRHLPLWLALWLTGSAAVFGMQALRQWLVGRHGARLPAGTSPALVGLLRPRIALPEDFEQRFAPAERELILAHEQVHLRRLDNLWNLLACTLTALHWWNPLVWWAQRRFQADQELACDSAVLAARPDATTIYTRALLAAHDLTAHGAPLSSRWGSSHPLVERIAMLKHPTPLNRRHVLLLAVSVSALSAVAYAAEESTPPAGLGYLQLDVKVEQRRDDSKISRSFRVIGKDGERMMVVMTDRPDSLAGLTRLTLTSHQMSDHRALIESKVSRGEPEVELGQPRVVTSMGEMARIEFDDAVTGEKLAVELTPSALPADYQPPTRKPAIPPVKAQP